MRQLTRYQVHVISGLPDASPALPSSALFYHVQESAKAIKGFQINWPEDHSKVGFAPFQTFPCLTKLTFDSYMISSLDKCGALACLLEQMKPFTASPNSLAAPSLYLEESWATAARFTSTSTRILSLSLPSLQQTVV